MWNSGTLAPLILGPQSPPLDVQHSVSRQKKKVTGGSWMAKFS